MPKKNNLVVNTTFAIGLISMLFANNVEAETSTQIQEQRSQIQTDIKKSEEEIAATREELIQLNEQIKRVDEAIKDNQQLIDDTEQDITSANEEVDQLNGEIVSIEEDIEKRYEILKERAVALQQKGGAVSYLEVVLGSESFTDFIDRVSLVTRIAEADTELMEQQKTDKFVLEQKQETVENTLKDLTTMKTELEGMQANILVQKEQNDQLKAELKEKEKNNLDIKAELELRDSSLALEQAELEREKERSNSDSNYNLLASEQDNSGGSTNTVSIPDGNVNDVVTVGNKYINNSVYVFGGGRSSYDIANGRFDCSGFVSWAFSQVGVSVGSSTSSLSGQGQKVSVSEMKPGDLVFFNTYKTNGHVGIYVGGNKFIGSQSSTGVAIADMGSGYWNDKFSGHVRRVMN
ncbi:coiled-coil domain-containing protein [Aquibacillus rhizosphaerae]|uniref:NlpC/P60 family protein n=1 Tax=Aquibacillus rhizosphaerae TaxID=3051431 RepID=A0ABT7L0H8_9BACI|nr:C40 family peptidase [Aquibacillus sp. LR5S19]MDL4839334.1 NlpC/P60 family protein [Aquibacillus sp. LR5S19]